MKAVGYGLVSLQMVMIEQLKGIRCIVLSNYSESSAVPELLCSVIMVQWHNRVLQRLCV